MQPPIEADKALNILVLRTLGVSQDNVALMVRCRKAVVSGTERWFSIGLSYSQATTFANDQTIKRIATREFAFLGLTDEDLEKIKRITRDDILRHFRIGDYLASSSEVTCTNKDYLLRQTLRRLEGIPQSIQRANVKSCGNSFQPSGLLSCLWNPLA